MTHDRLDTPIPCNQEALPIGGLCYIHRKYADGLCEPDYDERDYSLGGRSTEGLRSITNQRTDKAIWTRQERG